MTKSTSLLVRGVVAAAVVTGALLLVRARTRSTADEAHAAGPASSGPAPRASEGGAAPKGTAGGKDGPPVRITSVLTAPVERRDVPIWIEGLGSVSAWQQVTVRPQVDGRLDHVYFTEGQRVKKGQLLAQIDPRPFNVQLHTAQAALARDQAQYDGARRNLERYTELRKTDLVAQQQVDDQAALVGQYDGALRGDRAAVESARLNLDFAAVRAPLDGVLGVRLIDAGNLVRASDATGLVVITQIDPVAVLFTIPQDDLPRIAAAQARGEVRVEAWSRDGATRLGAGRLVVVDNQINQATSTLRLKAVMDNKGGQLWPNQFVKARLLAETRLGALVVAAAAVQRGPQGPFVYVADGGKADMRAVEVLSTVGELAMIRGKVEPGELVIVEGQGQLRPGAPVSARPSPGAPATGSNAGGGAAGGGHGGGGGAAGAGGGPGAKSR